jgi:hypothetical protein
MLFSQPRLVDESGVSFWVPGFFGNLAATPQQIGPQFGYVFPLSQCLQGYINLKAYAEFAGSDRPSGWNTWLTFAISPAAALSSSASRMATK